MDMDHLEQRLRNVMEAIGREDVLRARFLNTLSYMEHIGATKIARSQSGPAADFMTLKHAAEEARHAFYLKKLCLKVRSHDCPDYTFPFLLAPVLSRQYLYHLDVAVARMVKAAGLEGAALRKLAYLLVTFAIEVRADALYPVVEGYLERYPERISVASIIAEEEGHLAEMEASLAGYPDGLQALKEKAMVYEGGLFDEWLGQLERELGVWAGAAAVAVNAD
jgi:hypothetical protein